uniref:TRAF-type domain-containing protein n=1 Tax=Chromera velia CCMP2878 TaxID=1169474 RepID=A0A0G4G0P3_9ALVE|eukprot:Cvel_19632.t1-p1 / transcript=Cvel_19632.t1 / gene=Cvel_19632 / organism=Chromera_velia_CCMP2878 / gene_product=TNF receptor-associated factor 4, putative / transcript_product=TNF receptor-associated factor 4, putative / location=Cvel_scaffold1709:12939-18680(+) / protein_length=999 / sequence_SO=supercontig / SO=protein_coding / is_pseudo=false
MVWKCQYHEAGCPFKGLIVQVEEHLNTDCLDVLLQCPHKCKMNIPRREMQKHVSTSCVKAPVPCPNNCGELSQRAVLQSHLLECVAAVVPCPHECGKEFMRGACDAHMKGCPKFPVECPNACGVQPPRDSLDDHLTHACDHTVNACPVPGCGLRMQRKAIKGHSGFCAKLHRDRHKLGQRGSVKRFRWTFPDFESALGEGRDLFDSRMIKVFGMRRKLVFYPQGFGRSSGKASIFLAGPNNYAHRVNCTVSISVVNGKDEKIRAVRRGNRNEFGEGWGFDLCETSALVDAARQGAEGTLELRIGFYLSEDVEKNQRQRWTLTVLVIRCPLCQSRDPPAETSSERRKDGLTSWHSVHSNGKGKGKDRKRRWMLDARSPYGMRWRCRSLKICLLKRWRDITASPRRLALCLEKRPQKEPSPCRTVSDKPNPCCCGIASERSPTSCLLSRSVKWPGSGALPLIPMLLSSSPFPQGVDCRVSFPSLERGEVHLLEVAEIQVEQKGALLHAGTKFYRTTDGGAGYVTARWDEGRFRSIEERKDRPVSSSLEEIRIDSLPNRDPSKPLEVGDAVVSCREHTCTSSGRLIEKGQVGHLFRKTSEALYCNIKFPRWSEETEWKGEMMQEIQLEPFANRVRPGSTVRSRKGRPFGGHQSIGTVMSIGRYFDRFVSVDFGGDSEATCSLTELEPVDMTNASCQEGGRETRKTLSTWSEDLSQIRPSADDRLYFLSSFVADWSGISSEAFEGKEGFVVDCEWREKVGLVLISQFGVCGLMAGRVEGGLDDFELVEEPNVDPSKPLQVGDAVTFDCGETGWVKMVFGEFEFVVVEDTRAPQSEIRRCMVLNVKANRLRPGVRVRVREGEGQVVGGSAGLPPGRRETVGFVQKIQYGQVMVDFFGLVVVCEPNQLEIVEVAEAGSQCDDTNVDVETPSRPTNGEDLPTSPDSQADCQAASTRSGKGDREKTEVVELRDDEVTENPSRFRLGHSPCVALAGGLPASPPNQRRI